MTKTKAVPIEFELKRNIALGLMAPIKPAESSSKGVDQLFFAKRTAASRGLPPYYLVYFLLIDLLAFPNSGQFEKVAWSVPIDFNGRAYTIEYRKMGLGVFTTAAIDDEDAAGEIVKRIKMAVGVAQPFFDWLASDAVNRSAVNVTNHSSQLYARYHFLLVLYQAKESEAVRRKQQLMVREEANCRISLYPPFQLQREAQWLALSAVEAFFSWSEHVLIHLAILTGRILTAQEVSSVAGSDWADKFKHALDLTDAKTKSLFDRMVGLRRELRNYVAHGAFGKDGEAFSFHSGTGAVPVLLPKKAKSRRFRLGPGLQFRAEQSIELLKEFETILWAGSRAAAKIYIQDHGLPIILTMVSDGTYSRAMASQSNMAEFVEALCSAMDDSANMDYW